MTKYESGTNTDAVLLDAKCDGPKSIISSHKTNTGENVTTGIEQSARVLLQNVSVTPESVVSVMIGTTVRSIQLER